MHGLSFATKLEAGGTGRLKTIAVVAAGALLVAGCGAPKVRSNGNPKNPGPTQKIHLVWKQSTNSWKVKLKDGGAEEDPKTAKTLIPYDTGPTMFEVDIEGSAPATFKDSDALSVWTGSKSSPQSGIKSTQILGPIVFTDKNKKQKLIFWDLNQGDAVTLNYGIQFNESGVPPVDPIIDNGGGDRQ